MKHLFLINILITVASCYDCWNTGCQPESWAQRGCAHEPDNKIETGRTSCPNGYIYTCCNNTDLGIGSCWESKCGVATCEPFLGHYVNATHACSDDDSKQFQKSICCRGSGSGSTATTDESSEAAKGTAAGTVHVGLAMIPIILQTAL